MNIKVHYLVTFIALCSFGVLIAKPEIFSSEQSIERLCKLERGKMECINRYTEYKINHIDISYDYQTN